MHARPANQTPLRLPRKTAHTSRSTRSWVAAACLIALAASPSQADVLATGRETTGRGTTGPGATGPGTRATIRLRSRTFVPATARVALEALPASLSTRHYLVQLRFPEGPDERQRLRELGVELGRYVPDDTWIATIPRAAVQDVRVRERLAWAARLEPEDKMPRRLVEGRPGAWARGPGDRVLVRIRLHDDVDRAAASSRLEAIGVHVVGMSEGSGFPIATAALDIGALSDAASLDDVLWISEAPPPVTFDNDGIRASTGTDALHDAPLHLTGHGVRVGVWDAGGIDPTHPDFAGRLIFGESVRTHRHTTHVGGTLGASGAASASHGGTPFQWRGVAPGVTIYSWDVDGDVVAEVRNGVDRYGLDVDTNSWGFSVDESNCEAFGDYDFLAPEFDALVRGFDGKPLVVCFSAGNDRDDGDCPLLDGEYGCISPPKTAKNVIVVGANNSDDDAMTSYSAWGPVDDGRLKPDVVAPGCESGGEGCIRSTQPGGGYGGPGWCGTSMSAPAAAGGAALLLELYGGLHGPAPPAPSLVKALLVGTAVDLGNVGPDYAFGHGRVAFAAAAEALLVDSPASYVLDDGDVVEIPFAVPEGLPALRFALVWDDPDALPLSAPALVNDLDLALLAPDASIVHPWVLDPAHPGENAQRGVDAVNNVEEIGVTTPMPGAWILRITGTNVPEGPQVASLAGLDARPPAAPSDLVVSATTERSLSLTWSRVSASDRRGTVIVRAKRAPPAWSVLPRGASYAAGDPTPAGFRIVYVGDADHSEDPFVDEGLEPGTTYYYAAYAFDDMHNYSTEARAWGKTLGALGIQPLSPRADALALAPHPNPATRSSSIVFALPAPGRARLTVFDASGRHVRTLVNDTLAAGTYTVAWDGRDVRGAPVAAGIYFVDLAAPGGRIRRALSWLK